MAAPTISSVVIGTNGLTVTITYSVSSEADSPQGNGYTVQSTRGTATLAYVSGTGTNAWTLTASRVIAASETSTLDYLSTAGDVKEIISGDAMVTFTDQATTNNSAIFLSAATLSANVVGLL